MYPTGCQPIRAPRACQRPWRRYLGQLLDGARRVLCGPGDDSAQRERPSGRLGYMSATGK
jgi:hypothetical protein